MATNNSTYPCPDCKTVCTPWTTSGTQFYIECKKPACKRHMITVEVSHWLALTPDEIAAHNNSHVTYAVAKARAEAKKAAQV